MDYSILIGNILGYTVIGTEIFLLMFFAFEKPLNKIVSKIIAKILKIDK